MSRIVARVLSLFAASSWFLFAAEPAAAMTRTELEQARQFVLGIYLRVPEMHFDYAKQRYAPELRKLIDRDQRYELASGYVGVLDSVPFCFCQDTMEDYRVTRSEVRSTGPKRATVTVWLMNGTLGRFAIDLVRQGPGRFAIVDIHSHDMPSMLAVYRKYGPEEER
jgi:hypothetical protein